MTDIKYPYGIRTVVKCEDCVHHDVCLYKGTIANSIEKIKNQCALLPCNARY